MITEEELTRWEQMANATTTGRWRQCTWYPRFDDRAVSVIGNDGFIEANICETDAGVGVSHNTAQANAAFIAAAHEAVPALIAEVRRLKASLSCSICGSDVLGEAHWRECRNVNDADRQPLYVEHGDLAMKVLLGTATQSEIERLSFIRLQLDLSDVAEQNCRLRAENDRMMDRLVEFEELVGNAQPLGWAASGDMEGAQEWDKRAFKLVTGLTPEEAEHGLTSVCPGCYAVAPERCSPGCIDAEIAVERQEEDDLGPTDESMYDSDEPLTFDEEDARLAGCSIAEPEQRRASIFDSWKDEWAKLGVIPTASFDGGVSVVRLSHAQGWVETRYPDLGGAGNIATKVLRDLLEGLTPHDSWTSYSWRDA